MGCYRCNSPEGNEARLCPTCNLKKIDEQSTTIEKVAPRAEKQDTVASLTPLQTNIAIAGAALIAFSAFWLLWPSRVATDEEVRTIVYGCLLAQGGHVSIQSESTRKLVETTDCHDVGTMCKDQISLDSCREFSGIARRNKQPEIPAETAPNS